MSDNFNTDLKDAKNLGSSHHGFTHWWHQRLTAITTMLLMIWLLYFIQVNVRSDLNDSIYQIRQPVNFIAFILLMLSSFYHGMLGMQVIIEDYVGSIFARNFLIIAIKLFCLVTVISLIFALFYVRTI